MYEDIMQLLAMDLAYYSLNKDVEGIRFTLVQIDMLGDYRSLDKEMYKSNGRSARHLCPI